MGFLKLLAVVAAISSVTFAVNTISEAFDSLGLTSFASAAAALNDSSEGQALLSMVLSGGNYSILAPNNDAFSDASALTSDSTLLLDTLAYHILRGSFSPSNSSSLNLTSAISPNHTIGRSMLNDSTYVTLEGNASQVVAWTIENSAITFLNQASNASVLNSTRINGTGLAVYVLSGILSIPPSMSSVLTNSSNTTSIAGLLNSTMIPSANGTNDTIGNILNAQRGITLFAPSNSAFSAVSSTLPVLEGNLTAFTTVLQNHIINGSTLYSSEIVNGSSMTSAAGEPLTFSTNSSGTYVTSGSTTAKIISTDMLCMNGVVHVIDNVFLNTDSDMSAANSAYVTFLLLSSHLLIRETK
ncbi:FAS1 domain-containing protein [Lentinula lateritia]|uniref:FAS1 domain-containing protein n=1 Tax=Lentinula aff. lateritia TaxID=2804960 RepID=A0ACC1TYL0_9AGAR|nr:FAS1 domain-containing protein [Lentinula aff. lateritia]KAJ3851668.1 FAS1 domain-containing protein [Lentinula lateritia]